MSVRAAPVAAPRRMKDVLGIICLHLLTRRLRNLPAGAFGKPRLSRGQGRRRVGATEGRSFGCPTVGGTEGRQRQRIGSGSRPRFAGCVIELPATVVPAGSMAAEDGPRCDPDTLLWDRDQHQGGSRDAGPV